jgi:ankyrin repeat protein
MAAAYGIKEFLSPQKEVAADIDSTMSIEGYTPLMTAVDEGEEGVAKLLIEASANVNFQQRHGLTALHVALATETGSLEEQERGKSGSTVRERVVRTLQDARCDINLQNKKGTTALMLASSRGHENQVKLLLDANADLHLENKQEPS